jgi:hypothetical protein
MAECSPSARRGGGGEIVGNADTTTHLHNKKRRRAESNRRTGLCRAKSGVRNGSLGDNYPAQRVWES